MADFGDLMRKAAEAKTALDAMSKSAATNNATQLAGEQKLTAARQAETQALKNEAAQVAQTADAYKAYNQQALYGGRSDMQSHLGDMERELNYETLLNRQRWLGFTSPQQAYAWRQNEYNQRLLMNRAEWAGYSTADQYIAYLQKQTGAWKDLNAQMLQRAQLYKDNAAAATQYYNAVQGAHKTVGQLASGENLAGVNALNDAIVGLPDQVTTQVNVDTSQAMAEIAAYRSALAAIPRSVSTQDNLVQGSNQVNRTASEEVNGIYAGTRGGPRAGTEKVTGVYSGTIGAPSPQTEHVTFDTNQAKSDLSGWLAELRKVPAHVETTAVFNDTKALADLAAFRAKAGNMASTETITEDVVAAGGAAGGGGGSPPATTTAAGADEPNPNDINAVAAAEKNLSAAMLNEKNNADAASAAEKNLSTATHDVALSAEAAASAASAAISKLQQLAKASTDSGDAAKYAYAAQVMQAAASKANGTAAMNTVAALAEQAAASHSAGEASSFAYTAQGQLRDALNGVVNPAIAAERVLRDLGGAAEDSGQSANRARGYWSLLTRQVTLWGGAFGSTELIGKVATWHILLDGIIEIFALWIPALAAAAIGLTAWGLAGAQAAEKIAKQMFNVWEVSTALNTSVPPLKKNMSDLAQAVQPQVYELFGDALTVLNTRGSAFSTIISETGGYLEKLGARITLMLTSGGNGLLDFFQTGAKDLAIIGRGFDSLIVILGNLIKATALTHIAEDLATIGDWVLKLIAIVTSMPTPVLAAVLALHGIILWGGLFVSLLAKAGLGVDLLVGKIGVLNGWAFKVASALGATNDQLVKLAEFSPAIAKVSDSLGGQVQDWSQFQVNVAKAGTSVEDLVNQTERGRGLMAEFGSGLDTAGKQALAMGIYTSSGRADVEKLAGSLSKEGEAAGVAATESDGFISKLSKMALGLPLVGGLLSKLASVPLIGWAAAAAVALAGVYTYLALLPDPTQKWINSLNQAVSKASIYQVIGVNVSALAAATTALANAQQHGVGNATELAGAQQQLSDQLSTELDHVGQISKAYGINMPQALDLMNTAGVTTNQLFSKQAGVWDQAAQQVKGLVLGYQAMGQQLGAVGGDLNVLTVSESSQVKEMGNLNTAWDSWTKTVSGSKTALISALQGFATFQTDAKATGASMTGLGASSLTLQNDFQTNFGNIEQLFDAFRNQQALTGKGNFTQFVKDAVAALLPMAGTSKAALAEISALAQEAGGPATTSLQALAKWTGNVKDPMEALYKATDTQTVAASGLSAEAQRLSNSLQSVLNPALAQASFAAAGGQKNLNAFATALMNTGPGSQQTIQAGRLVAQELLAIDKNSSQAKSTFVGWAESMGTSAANANKLWAQLTTGKGAIDSNSQSVDKLRTNLGKAYDAQAQLAKPGEWDTILSSFKNGTFYESTFLSFIPQVQNGLKDMNHAIGQFFAHDVPEALRVSSHAIESAWDATTSWFSRTVPHAFESAWDGMVNWFTQTVPHAFGVAWNATWNNVAAPVVKAFDDVESWVSSNFDKWWKTHGEAVEAVWKAVWDGMKSEALAIFDPIKTVATDFFHWFTMQGGVLASIWTGIRDTGVAIWGPIKDAALGMWTIILDTTKATWTEIVGIIKGAWDIVSAVAKVVWDVIFDFIVADLKSAADILVAVFKVGWDLVVALAKIAWDLIVAIINVTLDLITGHWATAWADMKALAEQVWNAIKLFGLQAWNAVEKAATQVWNAIWGAIKTASEQSWNALRNGFVAAWNAIWHAFDSTVVQPIGNFFTHTVPGWLSSISHTFSNTWSEVWSSFNNNVLKNIEHFFTSSMPAWISSVGSGIKSTFQAAFEWAIDKAVSIINTPINFINNDVLKHLPGGLKIPTISVPFAAGGAAFQGSVPGPSAVDHQLAKLMGGEYVVRQPARMAFERDFGRGAMDWLNHYDSHSGSGSRGTPASQGAPFAAGGGYATGGPTMAAPPPRGGTGGDTGMHKYAGGGCATHGDNCPMAAGGKMVIPAMAGGGATGASVASAMLSYFESKVGHPYSQTLGRFGPEYYDCSGLAYEAAHAAGVTSLPQGDALANLEAEWFSKYDSDYTFNGRSQVQKGDLLFFQGADPAASSLGPIGHVGMAESAGTMVSAYDTQLGVARTPISNDAFVAGVRLGGAGGNNIITDLGQAISDLGSEIFSDLENLTADGGTALAGGLKGLAGDVAGGAKALLALAKQGARAVFDGVWNNTAGKMFNAAGKDTVPGTLSNATGDLIKQGIDSFMGAQDSNAQSQAASSGTPGAPGGISAGSAMNNLIQLAKYLTGHGATAIAASGIAGDVYGESAGNPESVGDGGFGLIGWTGNTQGLPNGFRPTGNASSDLAIEIAGVLGYINQNGGIGEVNAAKNVTQAGQIFSQRFERPAVLYSDTRPGVAQQVYNAIAAASAKASDAIGTAGNAAPTGVSSVPGHAMGGLIGMAAGGNAGGSGAKSSSTVNTVQVPKVLGDTLLKAQQAISAAHLTYRGPRGAATNGGKNLAALQSPNAGSMVAKGSTVTVMTFVPKVVGLTVSAAQALLALEGLVGAPPSGATDPATSKVSSQTPVAGAKAARGSTVTLYVAATGSTFNTTGTSTGGSAGSQTWATDAAAMLADWNAWGGTWNTLLGEKKPANVTAAAWKQWEADLAIGVKSEKLMHPYMDLFKVPSSVTAGTFASLTGAGGTPLMGEILQAHTPPESDWVTKGVTPSGYVGHTRFPTQMAAGYNKFHTFAVALRNAQAALAARDSTQAGGGTPPSIVPSAIGAPARTTASPVNLQGFATMGGPLTGVSGGMGSLGFAMGGPVGLNQVASMFAMGLPVGNMTLPVQMPSAQMGQLRKSADLPRTLSAAASGSGNRIGMQVDSITVNNPVPEPPSQSITRSANRLAFLAGRGPV